VWCLTISRHSEMDTRACYDVSALKQLRVEIELQFTLQSGEGVIRSTKVIKSNKLLSTSMNAV